jgi:small subunit ribosomal protein S2
MNLPSLEDLLKAGAHFGHNPSKTHPKMKDFVFGVRKGIHIIDLDKTLVQLQKACDFAKDLASNGGKILFVSTKPQAKAIIKECAIEANMPYITERWLGGLFTNHHNVSKLIKTMKELRKKHNSDEILKYTKKEQSLSKKEWDKLEKVVGGLQDMVGLPQAVFIVDVKNDKTALLEARKKNIPVIAICDSNNKPDFIDYAIPSNDDAPKAIGLIVRAITDALKEGEKKAASRKEAGSKKE